MRSKGRRDLDDPNLFKQYNKDYPQAGCVGLLVHAVVIALVAWYYSK